jgi:integrating conjugative element protein (TIGR03749 family)
MNRSRSTRHAALRWMCATVGLLAALLPLRSHAVEILHWERLPLPISLIVGQERVIFIDRNIRVGIPSSINDRLHVQSAAGAIYVKANAPIEAARIQLQDADSGALILLDVKADSAKDGQGQLEPVHIVEGSRSATDVAQVDAPTPPATGSNVGTDARTSPTTPTPVALTRYAAQNLYAPLRTVEPLPGVSPVKTRSDLPLDTLLPSLPLRLSILAAWRLGEWCVTAVRLTHTGRAWLTLDPRALQGDFVTATFQHANVGPMGTPFDTTTIYLVTRGHGLAESLLPRISQIDAAGNLPRPADPAQSEATPGDHHEK